jgi:hypothetical protein
MWLGQSSRLAVEAFVVFGCGLILVSASLSVLKVHCFAICLLRVERLLFYSLGSFTCGATILAPQSVTEDDSAMARTEIANHEDDLTVILIQGHIFPRLFFLKLVFSS